MGGLRGLGIGWRPEIAGYVAGRTDLGFVEVIAESIHERLPDGLAALRDRGVPVVAHGVALGLGGAEPVPGDRIEHFARAVAATGAPVASEHIAFVRAGGLEAGHLLPLPRSREAVAAVVANARRVQEQLSVPLALEPIAALVEWPDDELTEARFLTEILDATGALLLLDIANVYANAVNRGEAPERLLDELDWDRVAYVHVAGGDLRDGLYHDTHAHRVPEEVLTLLEKYPVPAAMLERDGAYPPAAELDAELAAIARAARL
ncbi:DUF692 domain-containing protein [Hamadaea tsunoensis]|uniref:DUF692 domain-containing protein n=1 Tax=Hamadaea tsunoensis TaxID=53368 RepID=UPI0003F963F9|nr:DUF692 domain-containing protein [Hamadaea tsunoensis]